MRSRIISFFIPLSFTLLMPVVMMGQKNPGFALSLRQRVDSEILNLDRNLRLNQGKVDESARILSKAEQSIARAREQEARQSEDDEMYFDELTSVVSDFPRRGVYDSNRCQKMRTLLIANYEPTAQEDHVQLPALKSGLRILAALCGR